MSAPPDRRPFSAHEGAEDRDGRPVLTGRFERLLVANRGEVAVRIARAARRLGITPLGVYSDADVASGHLRSMERNFRLGPPAPRESYLSIARVLEAARALGAEAVHPGYGFLGESAELAEAVRAAGLVFVGPSTEAMRAMADKGDAKRLAADAGVPVLPGAAASDDLEELAARGRELGFPLLVKAAAGGGGRGMRRVESPDDLADALASAATEAKTAFGSGRLLLERAVDVARHVEVQVLGDAFGKVIHLGERDCSSQRRHQKVIEEAPAPDLGPTTRRRLLESAVRLARGVGYLGAGTVEMLVDGEDCWFLEMNTRLQVEHPVTEEVTGLDLVEWQLRIARGESLSIEQETVSPRGHAIEARLYAEDARADFAPRPGLVLRFVPPSGVRVRVETALFDGAGVRGEYDPMIAKVIAWGEDRDAARRRLASALRESVLLGVESNRELLVDYIEAPAFGERAPDTASLLEFVDGWRGRPPIEPPELHAVAALSLAGYLPSLARGAPPWSNSWPMAVPIELTSGDTGYELALVVSASGKAFVIEVDEREGHDGPRSFRMEGVTVDSRSAAPTDLAFAVGFDRPGGREAAEVYLPGAGSRREVDQVWVQLAGVAREVRRRRPSAEPEGGAGRVAAPMAGQVTQIAVAQGDVVSTGQTLFVLEAMKLEVRVKAPESGTVTEVAVRTGQHVRHRQVLGRVQPPSTRRDDPGPTPP